MGTGDPSNDEYARLRRAAATTRQRLVVRLCGEAGLRPAEIARLQPGDIEARLHDGSLYHFIAVRAEDGASDRHAHLPTGLKRDLDRYIESEDIGDGCIFDVSARRLQMLVAEAGEAAGGLDVSTADLRRHHARTQLRRGVPPSVVLAVGGWRRVDGFIASPESVDPATAAAAFARTDKGDDRVSTVLDRLDHPALLLDASGIIERVSRRFTAVIGRDEATLRGRELRNIATPIDDNDYTVAWETALAGETWRGRVACHGTDDDATEGILSLAVVGDPAQPAGFIATFETTDTDQSADGRLLAVQDRTLAAGTALAGASTRESVLSRACRALADGDTYRGAWAYETPVEGAAPAASAAGSEPPADGDALAAAAVVDGAVTAEGDTLAVPLSHDGTDYGAIVVAPARTPAPGERRTLAMLGGRIGGSLAAVEWKRLLLADAVLELKLRLQLPDTASLFADVSADLGCELTVEGLVPLDGESLLYYVSFDDVPTEQALSAVEERTEQARLVAAGRDASLLEVTTGSDSFPGAIIDRGANVRELTADRGTVELTCEMAPSADIRALVEGIRETYPSVRLLAKREVERSVRAPTEFQQALAERLTDRQRSVLQAAYHAGYFDWPRGSTAEELADSMGVSSPTLHNHLRRAQHKLLAAFFDDTEG